MKAGEKFRLGFVFGLLGFVPVFLFGWLGWVQVAQAGELQRDGKVPLRLDLAAATRQGHRIERTPGPRGRILDRNGAPLAYDREVYEVRASISVPTSIYADLDEYQAWLGRRARELALALASDPALADRQAARKEHEKRLYRLLAAEFGVARLDSGPGARLRQVPKSHRRHGEILVAARIDVLAVVEALRSLAARRELRGLLSLHFLPTFTRDYPDRELTYGFVGHVNTEWDHRDGGGRRLLTYGVAGLEAAAMLGDCRGSQRTLLRDGRGKSYFVAQAVRGSATPVLHSTLDLELQRIAVDLLREQAEAEFGVDGRKVSQPKWGALVLVEVGSGDVVAAASWHRGQQNGENTAFTPYQSLFEPGSIVKPLVLGYAYEVGAVDWSRVYDCRADGADYRASIRPLGRGNAVRDDHACTDLTPHGILVNSSNIGASLIGLGLAREQWRDYMRFYGFGAGLDLPLPHGRRGGWPRQSFDANVPERSFRANSAISFSFGYEFQVTAFHMARAYLRLLRGGASDLRVCRGVEYDGVWTPAPTSPVGASFSPRVRGAVSAAMADVMSPDTHATGSRVRDRIEQELGVDVYGLVAGKTGTAASMIGIPGRGRVSVRNASFVGFMPAERPRWLAVCVLQKDDSARFYGGSYAAPPAVRLLLQARQLAGQRRRHQESRPPGGQTR